MSAAEDRASGICARCQHHTDNGITRTVETGSGWGAIFVLCADTKACAKRAPALPRRYSG
jgi:hypothetical protein